MSVLGLGHLTFRAQGTTCLEQREKMNAQQNSQTAWHALEESEVASLLGVDFRHGLERNAIEERRQSYGTNQLSKRAGIPEWQRFLQQLHQPLIYILLAAAAITFSLNEYVDASVIFLVVLINAIVGYLQESKAEKAIEALAQMTSTNAVARREGRTLKIPAVDLVPGDVVLLQTGDKVPADLRLFQCKSLQADESTLTGESLPTTKSTSLMDMNTLMADRSNIAYAGTLVTHGQAEGVVWATGDNTETGRIAGLIHGADDLSTPLTRKIQQFSKILLIAILILATITFVIGLSRGENVVEMFMAAVALAVGAIPEGLPAAVTITLAIGVNRMAKRRAIIRKLPAVETLGSTTVVCSDKTGTLTENQMTVKEIFAGGNLFNVTGTGYNPEGKILLHDQPADLKTHDALHECLLAGLLCNDSKIVEENGTWKLQGDPTEASLIVAATKAGLCESEWTPVHERIDSIPFESEQQYMATLHNHHSPGQRVIFKKGAIERLIDRCRDMLTDEGETGELNADLICETAEAMAKKGMRVLAMARRFTHENHAELNHEHVKEGLTFIGLVGMIDPPRMEAIASVAKCQAAGVQVKMITGDHVITAKAIAKELGLRSPDKGELLAVTGGELANTPDLDLPDLVKHASVFARVAPEQKLKLVRTLQDMGHVVAMTGDGVNDAPALKQADIGIAMGFAGTEVAKGAADMLLTNDNFSSIEAAIEEGRGVFDNLTKFIVWTLPTNAGEGLIILTAILLGTALPVLPLHILWINMSTAILLGLMLVFEPKEKNLMQRSPRDPRRPILTSVMFLRITLVTLIMLAGAFGLFLLERKLWGTDLVEARTISMNVIVMVEAAFLLNCRSLTHSLFQVGTFSNKWIFIGLGTMLLSQIAITYLPWANAILQTAPLGLAAWGRIIGIGLLTFFIVEMEKSFRKRTSH